MGPSPVVAAVAVVVAAAMTQVVVDVVAEAVDLTVVAETGVESAAAVEQMVVGPDSRHGRAANAAESGVVEKE